MAQADGGSGRGDGADWERLSERQSEHPEVSSGVSVPSPEIDPWDRSDMGVIDVAAVLDFIRELRVIVDA